MTDTEKMAKALDKNTTKTKVTKHMLWLKENRFYNAGYVGGAINAILPDRTYRIPDNDNYSWFIFREGVDFVVVTCETVTTKTVTYTVEA